MPPALVLHAAVIRRPVRHADPHADLVPGLPAGAAAPPVGAAQHVAYLGREEVRGRAVARRAGAAVGRGPVAQERRLRSGERARGGGGGIRALPRELRDAEARPREAEPRRERQAAAARGPVARGGGRGVAARVGEVVVADGLCFPLEAPPAAAAQEEEEGRRGEEEEHADGDHGGDDGGGGVVGPGADEVVSERAGGGVCRRVCRRSCSAAWGGGCVGAG